MAHPSIVYSDTRLNTVVSHELAQAFSVIESTYGHTVSTERKGKNLLKFGENQEVGTTDSTIMDLPAGELHETYVAANLINSVSSGNNGDTVTLKVEGHTIDGSGNFTFVVQSVTLTGQTTAPLTTALARISRAYVDDSTDLVGKVYFYETDTVVAGVPQTATKIHLLIIAGKNNSSKCSTTISSQDYWILTNMTCEIIEKAISYAEVHLEIREKGKVFREHAHVSCSQSSNGFLEFLPHVIVSPNSDVRLTASADGASTYIGGAINGYLAIIE